MNRTRNLALAGLLLIAATQVAFAQAIRPNVSSSSGSGVTWSGAATQIAYGVGAAISGEAAFIYTAASNLLTVDSITSNNNTDLTFTGGGTGVLVFADGQTSSANTVDVTTGTNEDWRVAPNGTGSVQMKSGDSVIEALDSASAVATQWTVDTSGRTLICGGTGTGGCWNGTATTSVLGSNAAKGNATEVASIGEGITITGASATFQRWYGGGLTAYTNPQAAPSATCSAGGGTATVDISSSYVKFTNNNAGGCAVTLGETNAVDGAVVTLVVVSNTGGVVTIPDSANVHDGPTCVTTTGLGLNDTYTMIYQGTSNLWVGTGCTDN